MVYPVIENGYISFESLANGKAEWKDLLNARKMLKFSGWLHDYIKADEKQKNKELEFLK